MRQSRHNMSLSCRYLLFIALAAVCIGGCRSKPAAPQAPAVSANAWAVVDGRTITSDDVDKAYRRMHDTSQPVSDEETLAAKLNLLNDLITQDILLAKAAVLKIEASDTEIDNAYGEAKKNVPDDAFQQELKRRNLTTADMRDGLRHELVTQKVIEREVGSKINVTDQDVSDFFNANRAQFNIAEEGYHLAQIVITPLREAVLKTAPGSVSVVSGGCGHTILLVLSHETQGQRDLSTPGVKENITQALHDRREQLLRAAYLTSVRSDANVTNYAARRIV